MFPHLLMLLFLRGGPLVVVRRGPIRWPFFEQETTQCVPISILPKISLGDKIKVNSYLELPKEVEKGQKKEKERTQAFEGIVISKHSDGITPNSTSTVRKMFQGGGVEKLFVMDSPWIKSVEVVSSSIVKRSKLYYLRERTGKSARLKRRL
jgi:large subunit ribosomal protein L19